jgi:heme/copper-type cytochrome/quinol oxidase subunit 2
MVWRTLIVVVGFLAGSAGPVMGQAPAEVPLAMEKDRFVPVELRVPAGKAFVLVLTNKDDISHELDIPKLRIERKIRPGQTLKLRMPALKAGTYELVDDDSTPTLNGVIIAE